jgi:hypothetical protein
MLKGCDGWGLWRCSSSPDRLQQVAVQLEEMLSLRRCCRQLHPAIDLCLRQAIEQGVDTRKVLLLGSALGHQCVLSRLELADASPLFPPLRWWRRRWRWHAHSMLAPRKRAARPQRTPNYGVTSTMGKVPRPGCAEAPVASCEGEPGRRARGARLPLHRTCWLPRGCCCCTDPQIHV